MNSPFTCGPNPCEWICRGVATYPCAACLGTPPSTIVVRLPEFITGSPLTCDGNCDQLQGDYLLTATDECTWETEFVFNCSGTVTQWYRLTSWWIPPVIPPTGTWRTGLENYQSDPSGLIARYNWWESLLSIPLDCSAEHTIPWAGEGLVGPAYCYPQNLPIVINPATP